MKTTPYIKVKTQSLLEAGSVLIAKPFWNEEVFRHSVILITDYNERGACGIIINKMSNILLREILPGANANDILYYGGPSSQGIYSYVHSIPSMPGADYFGNGIYFGGVPAWVQQMAKERQIDFNKIRFCSGSVQWDAGELEAEITEGKWWLTKIYAQEIFDLSPVDLWSYILLNSGHIYGMFPDEQMDPSMN